MRAQSLQVNVANKKKKNKRLHTKEEKKRKIHKTIKSIFNFIYLHFLSSQPKKKTKTKISVRCHFTQSKSSLHHHRHTNIVLVTDFNFIGFEFGCVLNAMSNMHKFVQYQSSPKKNYSIRQQQCSTCVCDTAKFILFRGQS